MWKRLTSSFWLPEKVPLSNDLPNWNELSPQHKELTVKVFTGLTMLDTMQATVGEIVQILDSRTEQEQAVYTNIAFMQAGHGYYSGYKYQRGLEAHPERVDEMRTFTYELIDRLLRLELDYSSQLYALVDNPGINGVMAFVYYNADKALMNLGYEPRYEDEAATVESEILAALAPDSTETHDFFSGPGSAYVIGQAEETEDADWGF